MTSIEDRIAAHPVADAMDEWKDAIADGCRWSVLSSDRERMAAAEAALVAALNAEEQRRRNTLYLVNTIRRAITAWGKGGLTPAGVRSLMNALDDLAKRLES